MARPNHFFKKKARTQGDVRTTVRLGALLCLLQLSLLLSHCVPGCGTDFPGAKTLLRCVGAPGKSEEGEAVHLFHFETLRARRCAAAVRHCAKTST